MGDIVLPCKCRAVQIKPEFFTLQPVSPFLFIPVACGGLLLATFLYMATVDLGCLRTSTMAMLPRPYRPSLIFSPAPSPSLVFSTWIFAVILWSGPVPSHWCLYFVSTICSYKCAKQFPDLSEQFCAHVEMLKEATKLLPLTRMNLVAVNVVISVNE